MAKARSVTARFTMEVAPAKVLSRRRTAAAPVGRLDPIAEDDREQLAYWSEYHQQQLQQVADDGEFIRDLGKCLSDGHGGHRGRRGSSRNGHRRRVVV
ncbi:unnamed protein product [Urochloa humidicola]